MIRLMLGGALLFASFEQASAQTNLCVGDQKGNSQAVMEAAGVLKDVPCSAFPLPLWERVARRDSGETGEGSLRVHISGIDRVDRYPSSGATRHLLPQGEKVSNAHRPPSNYFSCVPDA